MHPGAHLLREKSPQWLTACHPPVLRQDNGWTGHLFTCCDRDGAAEEGTTMVGDSRASNDQLESRFSCATPGLSFTPQLTRDNH